MKVFRTLSLRLFVFLFVVMATVLFVYAFVNLRTLSRLWVHAAQENADQTSELVKRATHYAMLLNRKDDIHRTIHNLAQGKGIAGIRVYDKQGQIIFSALEEEIGRQVDLQAEACVRCHEQGQPLRSLPSDNRMRTYRAPDGDRVLGWINPIENEPGCYLAACHAHDAEQTILGVLDVTISMKGLDVMMGSTRDQVITATFAGALLMAATSGLLIYRMVRIPVKRLIDGTQRVAVGDFGTPVPVTEGGEFGDLAATFNVMTHEIERARDELTEWSSKLEQKVMEKTEELGRSNRRILQMEKMASLGKLAASVAHELNNPLAGALTYAKLISRGLREGEEGRQGDEELLRYAEHIRHECARCGDIVKNLLLFSRTSGAKLGHYSLREIIQRSLMVVRHHAGMANVEVVAPDLAGDDDLVCDGNRIEQALVALYVNAVEAMPEGGVLTVEVAAAPDGFLVTVRDTGCGISEQDLPHLFEPFFSSKEATTQVGLGLSVAYGIMQQHHGRIEVDSTLGEGTVFRLHLSRDARTESDEAEVVP